MATPSPSKRKGVTALDGEYWKPLEEKRRRTAPPVFTVDDPYYSKIEKTLIKTVLVESKTESTPKKKDTKTSKKEVESKNSRKSTPDKKKRDSKTEKAKEKKNKEDVTIDSPVRVRKSGSRTYLRKSRSASSSPSNKTTKVETSSNIESIDGTESEVSDKKEDTDSEVDILSLDDDDTPKLIDVRAEKPKEETTESKDTKPQRKRKHKEDSETKRPKKEKLKRTSSVKTRALKTDTKKKHEKSLRLDEALSRTDMEGWSQARINAYKAIETNPNMYYYRFNAPGEKQKNGAWTEEEKVLFEKRMEELGGTGDYQWGIFSMAIPGRVGYQCANYYRKLIKEGTIKDDNYSLNDKGEPVYIGGKSKKKSKKSKEEEGHSEEEERASRRKSKKENKENVKVEDNSPPPKKAKKESTPKKETPKKENLKKETPKKESTPKKETPKKETPKKDSPKKESPKKFKQMSLDQMMKTDKEVTPEKPKRGRPKKERGKKKRGPLSPEEKLAKSQEKKRLDLEKKQQEKDLKAQRKLDLERELEERFKGKEIIPRIFLGNKDVARNQEWLQENKVKYVLNVTREVGNYFEEDIEYKRVLIDDSMDQDIAKHFEDSSLFINKALNESEHNILIHCNEGRSRSVTLCIAYLMKHQNMDLNSAYNHIHSKNTTKINDGFKRQLMSFESSLGLQKSIEFFPSRRNSKENILSNSSNKTTSPVAIKELTEDQPSDMKSLFSKGLTNSNSNVSSLNLELLPEASDDLSLMSLEDIPGTSPNTALITPDQLITAKHLIVPTPPPVVPSTSSTNGDCISDMEEEPLSDPMYWGAEIYDNNAVVRENNSVSGDSSSVSQQIKGEELLSVGLDDEWLNGILTQ